MKQKHVHMNAKAIQRSKGKSAVAAAAYRSGEELKDERRNDVHDYTRKQGVDDNFIIGYEGSREELWNLAEQSESRKDATTAREFDIALPNEISANDRVQLAKDYGNYLNKEHGCAVDVCIHDLHGDNPHMHVMMTTRSIEPDGSMSKEKISREWSDSKRKKHGLSGRKTELEKDRKQYSDMSNKMLRQAGVNDVTYDHKSYKRQGSEKKATKHHGPRDDLRSRLIKQYNEAVQRFNQSIDEIEGLKTEIKNRPIESEPVPDPEPVNTSKPKEEKQKTNQKEQEQGPYISPKIQQSLSRVRKQMDNAGEFSDSQNMFPPEYMQRDSDWYQQTGNEIYDDLSGQKREREMNQPKPQQPTRGSEGPTMKGPGGM